jgi:hypothetical protein
LSIDGSTASGPGVSALPTMLATRPAPMRPMTGHSDRLTGRPSGNNGAINVRITPIHPKNPQFPTHIASMPNGSPATTWRAIPLYVTAARWAPAKTPTHRKSQPIRFAGSRLAMSHPTAG